MNFYFFIATATDATVAMAERIAGTESNFVKMMNDKAEKLGLNCTNFQNATGLDADDHYSCAHDMAMIAKELVKHEKILEFTGTYEDYLRTDTNNKFWLVNTNKLVRYYDGADGLKTGYTNEAGYCLTTTAMKDGMRLITVVMNEPSSAVRSAETSNLLDYGFNMYSLDKVLTKQSVLDNVKVELGDIEYVDVVPSEDVNILNNKTGSVKKVDYDYEINDLKAPIKVGEVVGKLNIKIDGKLVNTIDLTVDEDVFKANFLKVLARNFKSVIQGTFL